MSVAEIQHLLRRLPNWGSARVLEYNAATGRHEWYTTPALAGIQLVGAGATVNGASPNPTRLKILDGSSGTPITNTDISTVLISRYENITAPPGAHSGALYVTVEGVGTAQPQGILVSAVRGSGNGDVLGVGIIASNTSGNGAAFGLFIEVVNGSNGSSVCAFEYSLNNNSSVNVAFDPVTTSNNKHIGIDHYVAAGSGKYGSAFELYRGVGQVDVGLGFMAGSHIRTTTIHDATTNTQTLKIAGAKTHLIDAESATVSGYALHLMGTNGLATANATGHSIFMDQTAFAINQGARLVLGGKYSSSDYAEFGAIAGIKENSTAGNYAGSLALYTRANSASNWGAPKVMIDSAGVTSAYGVVQITPASGTASLILQRATATNCTGSIEFYGSGGSGGVKWGIMTDSLVSNAFTIQAAAAGTYAGNFFILNTAGALRLGAYGAGTATFDASGNITSVSDERLKNRTRDVSQGLTELLTITPFVGTWREESGLDTEHPQVFFSAQEVQAVLPEAVGVTQAGYRTLDDRGVLAMHHNAIKELALRVQSLEARN